LLVLKVKWLPPKAKRQHPPHTLCHGRASSPQSLLLPYYRFRQLLVGCCVFFFKWNPSKAEEPPPSLFFDGCNIGTQNKGMESIQSAPDASRHRRTHSYPWHKELGQAEVPLEIEGNKLLDRRVAVAHLVVCCVLCIVLILFAFLLLIVG
jgi:hypothetical protein